MVPITKLPVTWLINEMGPSATALSCSQLQCKVNDNPITDVTLNGTNHV